MTAAEYADRLVLDYYGAEAAGRPCPPNAPLAGLKLNAFRAARERLYRNGYLARSTRGRYVPTVVVPR